VLQVQQLREHFAFLQGEKGQTLVEYGLLLAMIALVGLAGVMVMVGGVNELFQVAKGAYDAMCVAVGDGGCI
jgi:Flp pilus assembly pilin Flp